jgi:lipopolysaccharide transport system ATP-binding protein
VGTGFHQELTGRENVYLNGTVLGMTKREIDRKFDEIVAFSGVERFIDTPVKRYSSGMAVRLAFAVAAHLEPEILLVDEVLAVGDAAFQKKCLGKMSAVAREGRTVLFVSHNMGAITQLCQRTILIESGRIAMDGHSSDVVLAYLTEGASGQQVWHNSEGLRPDMEAQIQSVRLLSRAGQPRALFPFSSPFNIEITYDVSRPVRDLSVTYHLFDSQGTLVFESMDTDMAEWKGCLRQPGRYLAVCSLPGGFLKPGRYHLSVVAFVERVKIIDRHEGVVSFDISEVGYHLNPGRYGVVAPVFKWEITRFDSVKTSACDSSESASHPG